VYVGHQISYEYEQLNRRNKFSEGMFSVCSVFLHVEQPVFQEIWASKNLQDCIGKKHVAVKRKQQSKPNAIGKVMETTLESTCKVTMHRVLYEVYYYSCLLVCLLYLLKIFSRAPAIIFITMYALESYHNFNLTKSKNS
jgi:hypothetical protein